MLILNMAMNIHVTVRFLQLKKESPHLSKSDVIFEASIPPVQDSAKDILSLFLLSFFTMEFIK